MSHPASAAQCDNLFVTLGQRIPGLKRHQAQGCCGFFREGSNRFVYVYHRKRLSRLGVWFSGGVAKDARYAGLKVRSRNPSTGGFGRDLKARFFLNDPEQIPMAVDLLYESSTDNIFQRGSSDADETSAIETAKFDLREDVSQQIRRRRGQRKFRDALRKRYRDTCVVTGCKIIDLLEAAHIRTMPGVDDNSPDNGLLLRADIHTLFDLNLLGIDPTTLKVRLHDSIKTSEYAEYDGQPLRDQNGKPLMDSGSHPSVDALSGRVLTVRPSGAIPNIASEQ